MFHRLAGFARGNGQVERFEFRQEMFHAPGKKTGDRAVGNDGDAAADPALHQSANGVEQAVPDEDVVGARAEVDADRAGRRQAGVDGDGLGCHAPI